MLLTASIRGIAIPVYGNVRMIAA